MLFAADGDTVGAALNWNSVMMTGLDVQGLGAHNQPENISQVMLGMEENKNINCKYKPNGNLKQDDISR